MTPSRPKPLTAPEVLAKLRTVGDDLDAAPVGTANRLDLLRQQADLSDQRAAHADARRRGD